MPSLIRPKPEYVIEDVSVEHSQITFPIEIWLLIAQYLSIIDICNLLPVNTLLRSLAEEGAIWTVRCGIVVKPPGVTLHRAWVLATHHVYTAQDDLQFMGDGNHCRISGRVDKVKRSFGNDDLLYARKSILIREQKTSALATSIFLEEAKKILRAKHSHVVKIVEIYFLNMEHDYGDNAVFSIIMERADGNLDDYLTGMKSREEMGQLASWFGCLIRATAHIHGRGIPHQSIKPSNILVKNKRLLLADFGISKVSPKRLPGGRAPGMDRPDKWPRYFSAPEAEGLPADIFSLGAVFLEMLIAHSCPLERQELVRITGVREYYSYADRLDWVHSFIDELPNRVSEKWCLKILAISKSYTSTFGPKSEWKVYTTYYGFNIGELGIAFTCVIIGALIALAIYAIYVRWAVTPDLKKNGTRPQEHRLIPALFACFGPPVGLFLFAWTSTPNIHWIAPTIGIVIYAGSVFIILQCIFMYVPMSYPQYAASLFAGNDFCRSAMACGSIMFARPLFLNLGIGKGVSLLGGLSCIGIGGIWILYYTGARLRANSKFAI